MNPEHDFRATDLTLAYDGRRVVEGLDLRIPDGRITAIVGANASGKSTTLRGLARLMKPIRGTVTLDGTDVGSANSTWFAKLVGLLPQQPIAPEGITVSDLVGRGRYPHQGWFRRWTHADDEIVARALAATDTLDLASSSIDELSGGQRQRVWIAMALAQETDILLLDEPTTFLDVTHQVEVLDLLTELNRERGTTVVMVLHDLNLAARYADELVVMASGRIVAQGTPSDALTESVVRQAFSLECRIVPDPVSATPMVIPIGRFHSTVDSVPATNV